MLDLSQCAVWNIWKQVVFDLNIQPKTHISSNNIVSSVIHGAGYLIFPEIIGCTYNTFGLDMRQLSSCQEQKPRQRIKDKCVINPNPIENIQKQHNIPSFVFDAVDLPSESSNTHQYARIEMLKPVLKIIGMVRRIAKCQLMAIEIGVKRGIGEAVVQIVMVPFPFFGSKDGCNRNVGDQRV